MPQKPKIWEVGKKEKHNQRKRRYTGFIQKLLLTTKESIVFSSKH